MSLVAQAKALTAAGRYADAVTLLEPAMGRGGDLPTRTAYARALKLDGRQEEALVAYADAVGAFPTSGVAEHNLASLLGDAHRHAEAAEHARAAVAKGVDAPETWLVLARALHGLGRLEEAERAFRHALARRPGWADALRDLSQLLWMRTGDAAAAVVPLDAAARAAPHDPTPVILKARVLQATSGPEAAFAELAAALDSDWPDRTDLELAASAAALESGRPETALALVEAVVLRTGGSGPGALLFCDALLGVGRVDDAAAVAERLHARSPDDGGPLSRLYVAWRLFGDPRAAELYDYPTMVSAQRLDTPPGWSDLDAYLADLAPALERSHAFSAHPFDQSLRGGSQTSADLRVHADPVVRAFFTAVDGPIRRYLAALGSGPDPLRRRNTGQYRLNGAWSVRLRGGGFHTNHVHPQGWISSACYIRLPAAVGTGRQGWIKFGEPGVKSRPPLQAEHVVRPEPGLLVLFPSYMWHGTVPFDGEEPRLTCAFDVVPA